MKDVLAVAPPLFVGAFSIRVFCSCWGGLDWLPLLEDWCLLGAAAAVLFVDGAAVTLLGFVSFYITVVSTTNTLVVLTSYWSSSSICFFETNAEARLKL